MLATLLKYDSVHGRSDGTAGAQPDRVLQPSPADREREEEHGAHLTKLHGVHDRE